MFNSFAEMELAILCGPSVRQNSHFALQIAVAHHTRSTTTNYDEGASTDGLRGISSQRIKAAILPQVYVPYRPPEINAYTSWEAYQSAAGPL
jgi:hypothetical protein